MSHFLDLVDQDEIARTLGSELGIISDLDSSKRLSRKEKD